MSFYSLSIFLASFLLSCTGFFTSLARAAGSADINADGKIDIFDYNILLRQFGTVGTGLSADITLDGRVDMYDYNLLVGSFGTVAVLPSPAPTATYYVASANPDGC